MHASKRVSKKSVKKKKGAMRNERSARGKRFTPAQQAHAVDLVSSGMNRKAVAEAIGTTVESVRRWVGKAEAAGTMPSHCEAVVREEKPQASEEHEVVEEMASPASDVRTAPLKPGSIYAPRDPGQGLAGEEQESILDLKKKHPSMGPAQIRAQLKRFKGWRVSIKAIAKVLRDNGYELVHVASRPKGDENPHRWEAPRRNAVWQMDLTDLRVGPEKRALAVMIDDFSRFVVGWEVFEAPSGARTVGVL